jgi:hypothetical protein
MGFSRWQFRFCCKNTEKLPSTTLESSRAQFLTDGKILVACNKRGRQPNLRTSSVTPADIHNGTKRFREW